MRMMLCPPTWPTWVCSAMSVLRWSVSVSVSVDVVGVGVGALDVGEAEVGDGEADERWLADADALADWEVSGVRRQARPPAASALER